MTEGNAGFAVETISEMADAELELGGPRCGGVLIKLASSGRPVMICR
jgi:hypothetical protein